MLKWQTCKPFEKQIEIISSVFFSRGHNPTKKRNLRGERRRFEFVPQSEQAINNILGLAEMRMKKQISSETPLLAK